MCIRDRYQDDDASGGEKNTVKRKALKDDTVTNRILNWNFSKEQKEEAKAAMKEGIPVKRILEYFYPETSVEEMRNKFRS